MEEKKQLLMLVGPPGSGKSTYANKHIEANKYSEVDVAYINQDSQGKEGHLDLFKQALVDEKNIIVDRMNFSRKQRLRYLEPARKAKYEIHIVVLHVPMKECLERCNKRENHPTVKTEEDAQNAVTFFFKNYGRVKDKEADKVTRLGWDNKDKIDVVVCDLDGTLAKIDHRLHWVRNEDKKERNWKKFFDEMYLDEVNEWCRTLLVNMSNNNMIIYATGRPGEYMDITREWLVDNRLAFSGFELYSRLEGDYRADTQIKEIILEFEILPRYGILFVVDDRPSVCRMWRERGVTVLQCQDKEF